MRILRRHHGLRDLLAGMLGEAGIFVLREQREPRWDREVPAQGGGTRWEAAVLDLRMEDPPAAPLAYGDVVVPAPHAASCREGAAKEDGAAAAAAERGKHRRYPDAQGPGPLTPFAVESFGRWGSEGLDYLRGAAGAACERNPVLGLAGRNGAASLLASWLARLSVCLQRENAACFRSSVGLASMASLPGACGWEEEVEGLLLQAAAFATAVA